MFRQFTSHIPIPSEHVMSALGPLLLGLGISIHPYEYFGGMVMAIGGSILAWRVSDADNRKAFFRVVGTGVFVATVMAELHQVAVTKPDPNWFWQVAMFLPVQLMMALSGFASGWFIRTILKVGGRLESQVETITDRIINKFLPGDDK